jgi:flavin-binding protein dodecin
MIIVAFFYYLTLKIFHMSIVKVIEVISNSETSIEDAIQQAVAEASKTIHNIDSVYVKDIKAHVKDNKVTTYGVICKISFRLDDKK